MPHTNLSLGGLGKAIDNWTVGSTAVSMSGAAGTTTGPIAMSDFKVEGFTAISGDQFPIVTTTQDYTLTVSGSGTRFDRYSGKSHNATWATCTGIQMSPVANSGSKWSVYIDNADEGTDAVYCQWADGFNTSANGYNVGSTLGDPTRLTVTPSV